MANKEAIVKFKADTQEFASGIKSMNTDMATLRASLKLNSAEMKNNGSSVDLLKERHQLLSQKLADAQQKVDLTSKSLDVAKATFGENSAEVQKWQQKLIYAQVEVQNVSSELTRVSTALDNAESEASSAESALGKLTQKISEQESELAGLKQQYVNAMLEYGETSDEAQSLAKQISSLSDELSDNKAKMDAAKTAAEQLGTEQEDTRNAFEKLSDTISEQETELADLKKAYANAVLEYGETSDEAKALAKQVDQLSTDLGENRSAMQKAEEAADSLDNALEESADGGWSTYKQVVADLATDAIQKAAGAIKDLAGESIEAAATVNAESSQFAQTFGDLADDAAEAMARVADDSDILQTRLQGVGTSIYAFAKTTGMESSDAMSLMERALVVTADSAAYYDRSLEDTAESLKSFLKGNYENDTALGLSCTETTRNAAANALYGKSFSDLSEAQKQLTLLQMVEDANELSGAMGQAAREGEGWENVTGNLEEAQRQFLAVVGQPVLAAAVPIVQALTNGFSVLSSTVQSAQTWMSEHQTAVSVIAVAFGTLTAAVVAYNAAQALANIGAVASGAIQTGGTAAITASTVALGLHTAATTIATAATSAFGAVMAFVTSPITLVVVAIGALIAVGVALYKNWDTVKATASAVWDGIKTTVSGAFETIKNVVQVGIMFVAELISAAITLITLPWQFIWQNCHEYIEAAWEAIKKVVSTAITVVWATITTVLNTIKSTVTTVWNGIKTVTGTAWNAVESAVTTPINSAKAAVTTGVNAVKTTVSDVFSSVKSTVTTVWNGIKTAITTPISDAVTAVKSAIDKIKGFFSGLSLKLPDIKLPHFKLTGSFSLNPPSVPKLAIDWYAKGGVLTQPTIFGAMGGSLLGGGEAGPEAVAPIAVLQSYVADAVAAAFERSLGGLSSLLTAVADRPIILTVDGKAMMLATAGAADNVYGSRQLLTDRGLAL